MTGLVFGLLASALLSSGHSAVTATSQLPQATAWSFNGNAAAACAMASDGRATDKLGAQLEVHCEQDANILGNVLAKLPAEHIKQKRIVISAQVRSDEHMNASLWLKTSHNSTTLMFENDSEQNILNDANEDGWSQRVISLPVSTEATSISYGVLLQGSGSAEVRDLQVSVSQEGEISPEAQAVLDAAIDIVKEQNAARHDIAWTLLETDVRLFASGAQQTGDVYPAIKYMLAQLGDKRSLLLTPELAAAFSHASAATNAAAKVQVFTLPDGANLVLSAASADVDSRLARNWSAAQTVSQ